MPLAPGSNVGHYRIVSPLGAGGMGEVYRAQDTRLKREVALKVLPEAFAKDRERLTRITREAEVLASLNHPNIATIYGVEEGSLVMELVEGAAPRGPMAFDAAWKIGGQVVDALEYAHDRGIVHRDLKPANLMVTPEGVVKLLDFGLAKAFIPQAAAAANQEQSPTLTIGTQAGVILGTAAYMSPEQAKGKTVDRRADIWAFGTVFYELLSGQRLFQGEDLVETLAQVLTKEPDLQNVPPRARVLLQRCLEKDPKKRLRDIGEVRHYLDGSAAVAPAGKARAWLPWAITATTLLLGGAAYVARPAREDRVIRSFVLPPDQSNFRCLGDDGGPAALAPDGKHLTFAAPTADGKVLLWVRPLESLTSQPLAGSEGAAFPFWSPNSRSIGFFADSKLKKIDAGGGTVTVLTEAPTARGGTWNRDDVILFAPTFNSVVMRVAAGGGAVTPVTRLEESQQEVSHRWPSFLPDGQHFLFTSRNRGTYLASLDSAEPPRRLLEESTNAMFSAGFLINTSGFTLLARPFDARKGQISGAAVTVAQSVLTEMNSDRGCFTVSEQGLLAYHAALSDVQMSWMDRSGNRMGTVGGQGQVRGVELAPDGTRVAAVVRESTGVAGVWIYDLARSSKTRLNSAALYTGTIWSLDGTRVALGIKKDGSYDVVAKNADGAGTEELLFRSKADVIPGNWSSIGLTVTTRSPKTGWDVDYLPAGAGGTEHLPVAVLHGVANEMQGTLSPDGHWMLYLSDESGEGVQQAFLTEFPGGAIRRKVSTVEADMIRWNRNGKEFFLASRNKLMSVTIRSSAGKLEMDPPRTLFTMQADCAEIEVNCFDVSPDGNRFLVLEPVGPPPVVTLVQNWTAALKKQP